MGEVIIQTSGLTKRYGEKTAVNQLNLSGSQRRRGTDASGV